ncbi:MAG: CidA/LrgA family protein [Muribaculaceae bacterium]|nr:CidA/LrgA family protein [Muribaculaceae bacterium]
MNSKLRQIFLQFFELLLGLCILIFFYYISYLIVRVLNIPMPPAILGLILFAFALIEGLIKEQWVESICNLLIKNMAMFLTPFVGGLILYKSILVKNWLVIFLVIFITTTLTIMVTGYFTEYGLKRLRLHKIRKTRKEYD